MNTYLKLADGSSWHIAAEDKESSRIAEVLSSTMQLKSTIANGKRLLTLKNSHPSDTYSPSITFNPGFYSSCDNKVPVVCQVSKPNNNDELAIQLMKLSLVFCSGVEARGGLLIHGALAEKNGRGVILAGPGDVGKTTASRRIPPPWKSLSDDCTLIVRNSEGSYRAHPWPTWSTYMFGGSGGSWDVQHSVPLKAIFVLEQSPAENVKPLGRGETVCLLTETAEQAWFYLINELDEQQRKSMRLQRFNNICELTKNIPAYLLQISKTGAFWKEMDKILPGNAQ